MDCFPFFEICCVALVLKPLFDGIELLFRLCGRVTTFFHVLMALPLGLIGQGLLAAAFNCENVKRAFFLFSKIRAPSTDRHAPDQSS
jgi:hypothetical protein